LLTSNKSEKRNIPARGGKSIEFRKFSALAAATTALTEGTPPSGSNLTITAVSAVIAQYGDYVRGSDLVETQAIDNVLAETSELLGEQMGLTLDVIDRAVLQAGTNVIYSGTATARTAVGSGMLFDATVIRRGVRTLKRQNAKPVVDGKFVAVIHPDTTCDLFADSDVKQAFQYARERATGNPLFTGELGDFMGVRFVETTNAMIYASAGLSGADVYGTLLIGKNAYGITELDAMAAESTFVGTEPSKTDPLGQYWVSGWKAAHCAVILDQYNLVRAEHVCTIKQAA